MGRILLLALFGDTIFVSNLDHRVHCLYRINVQDRVNKSVPVISTIKYLTKQVRISLKHKEVCRIRYFYNNHRFKKTIRTHIFTVHCSTGYLVCPFFHLVQLFYCPSYELNLVLKLLLSVISTNHTCSKFIFKTGL